jgi:UDP-N-acetylmuramate--alanine ligase
MHLQNIGSVYFVGIGGIGMSGLARYFHARGVQVSGYDKTQTELTDALTAEGIFVHYTDDADMVPQADLVVYTPAVPQDIQIWQYIRQHGLPTMKRAGVLGLLSRNHRCIAVAGTHGKTTTSSILTHLMRVGQTDATAFLGGIAFNYGSNYIAGLGDWFIAEADEYDRSFMHLHPEVACVMHLDPDHLDIYGTTQEMRETYSRFVAQIKPGGKLFARHGMALVIPNTLAENGVQVLTFGIGVGDIQAQNIHVANDCFVFDYVSPSYILRQLACTLPGNHNIENCLAAISAALQAGVSEAHIREALSTFRGVRRRFDMLVRQPDMLYVDDYAHHPTELASAIAAARKLRPDARLTGVFQPHLFSRTNDFANDFAAALDTLDVPLLMEIYPAREKPMPGVTSHMLLDKMHNPNRRLVTVADMAHIAQIARPGVLMTLGAGDIDTWRQPLVDLLTSQSSGL